jgi:hypothetical protein
MDNLKLVMPLYVVDCDLNVIVAEIKTPCDRVWIGQKKADERASEHARQTGHSVCVTKPISWH